MPFYIRVPSLITPVHCITQTEEPNNKVVIEYDGLENGITQDLIARGIAKEDIILAFLPDSKKLI
jgi:hypothetical protein